MRMLVAQAVDSSAQGAAWPRLLGDIGGTNARFGWQSEPEGAIEQVQVLACAEHAGLLEAIEVYLSRTGWPRPPCAALGMAVAVTGDEIRMTNNPWHVSVERTRQALGLQTLLVLNDFTALALSLPSLPRHCFAPIGPDLKPNPGAIGVLGAGTGLGVSGLVPLPGTQQWAPLMGEGGHVSLSAANAQEFAVIEYLRQRHGHVSAERVLSGPGLVNLCHAIAAIRGHAGTPSITAAQVLDTGLRDPGSDAAQALNLFCAFLGTVAGDLALTLGARGGIYIGGGIAPRLRAHLDRSAFRQRFEAKGRYRAYLEAIPTWLIDVPVSPALLGASLALSTHLEARQLPGRG